MKGTYVGDQNPVERLRNKLSPFLNLVSILDKWKEKIEFKMPLASTAGDLIKQEIELCAKYISEIHDHLDDLDNVDSIEETLIPLEEANSAAHEFHRKMKTYPKPNGLACPLCKKELMDSEAAILCTSPAKRKVQCSSCDYIGYRIC